MMTISRLTAGAGYRYLTRTTATGDCARDAGVELTAYYTASGNPPGRWAGTGLRGLTTHDGVSLVAGSVVSEAQLGELFAHGRHPLTGTPLGNPYVQPKSVADRVSARIASLPADLTPAERDHAVAAIRAEEAARKPRTPVAGFDVTFSARKSVSVLWALSDPATQAMIVAAHRAAINDVIAYAEGAAIFTRVGRGGVAQVPTRGVVAAVFDHYDSRAGDPQLHSHVVIANKVQGRDGVWRSLDSKALHHATVTLSELYDSLLADRLTRDLGVGWETRDRGPRRSPGFEITGVPDPVLAHFSQRTTAITKALDELDQAFVNRHGREPSPVDNMRHRQQATLVTRPTKTIRHLRELLQSWRTRYTTLTGHHPDHLQNAAGVDTALVRAAGHRGAVLGTVGRQPQPAATCVWTHDSVPKDTVTALAAATLAGVAERRAVFNEWAIRAETLRVTRDLPMASTGDRIALLERITSQVSSTAVLLTPQDPVPVVPGFTRPDGASVFTRAGMTTFTTTELLTAEQRLLHTHLTDTTAPTALVVESRATTRVGADDAVDSQMNPEVEPDHVPHALVGLADDQAAAVEAISGSGRRIDVLIGPAGSGKTTTLAALRAVWEATHGSGSVIGLASSSNAAHVLREALGIGCANTHKWLHESSGPGAANRADDLMKQEQKRIRVLASGGSMHAVDSKIRYLHEEQELWSMRPGQLVILDEAGMSGTLILDQLREQAVAAGAKLVLVGDHHQLPSVEAGGALSLLADRGNPRELTSLWRFANPWEAEATRRLRDGDPTALDAYLTHDRIHTSTGERGKSPDQVDTLGAHIVRVGTDETDAVLDAAYRAWRADTDDGNDALLLAPSTEIVNVLNARAHDDAVTSGWVVGPFLQLGHASATATVAEDVPGTAPHVGDRGSVGIGDPIITRRNAYDVIAGDEEPVRNGDHWTVTDIHADGSLTATRRESGVPSAGADARVQGKTVWLPRNYVRDDVDLGYALTIHRAQGATTGHAHLVVTPGLSREDLYVGMTRGRQTNHAYVITEPPPKDATCIERSSGSADDGPQPATTSGTPVPQVDPTEMLREIIASPTTSRLGALQTVEHLTREAHNHARLRNVVDVLDSVRTDRASDRVFAAAATIRTILRHLYPTTGASHQTGRSSQRRAESLTSLSHNQSRSIGGTRGL